MNNNSLLNHYNNFMLLIKKNPVVYKPVYGSNSIAFYYLSTVWTKSKGKSQNIYIDTIKEKIEYIVNILNNEPELVSDYIERYEQNISYLSYYLNGNYELFGNILKGLLDTKVYSIKFLNSYNYRAFVMYLHGLDIALFFQNIIDIVSILRITKYCEKIIKEVEINNDSNTKLKKLKEIKKYITANALILTYFKKKNEEHIEENMRKFTTELLKKESSYSPVGSMKSYQGKEEEIQFGRIFDGLEIQWYTQGFNSTMENVYSNTRQKSESTHLWVSNRMKFEYILTNQEIATKIINSSDNISIVPLKNFIDKILGENNIEEIYIFLTSLCQCFTYLERAFVLYDFLLNYDISLEGKDNFQFKTIKGDNGTFLTPFYQLYYLIQKHMTMTKTNIRKFKNVPNNGSKNKQKPNKPKTISQKRKKIKKTFMP